jgi:saccharopine dehydrogenase-like NADP-dependent oxidoreductase
MVERTLRYPGHAALMRVLRETGFFSKEPIEIRGQTIRPLDLSARLLFPMWKLGEQEEEFTVMRVSVEGPARTYTYDLLDRYDAATQTSSMARTTGYTATGAARLVLEGGYRHPGISPPEYLGKSEENFRFMLKHLADRGVHYRVTQKQA